MVWELIRQALDFCLGKNPHLKDRESVVNLLLEEDSWVHSTFRYAISKGICAFLGMHHQELEEVYLTGSTVEDTAGFTSDIDLIMPNPLPGGPFYADAGPNPHFCRLFKTS